MLKKTEDVYIGLSFIMEPFCWSGAADVIGATLKVGLKKDRYLG
jgi:hypothetical protein